MNTEAVLTKREEEIAELFAWGASKKEVAGKLYVSVRTVENHARSIYEKTEVRSIGQLCAWWFCKNYHIPIKKVISAIICLILTGVNEVNINSDDMVRRLKVRDKYTLSSRYA